jgi:hypothetical protein
MTQQRMLLLAMLLVLPAVSQAQKLRPNPVSAKGAVVYRAAADGGNWRSEKVAVAGDGVHVGDEVIPSAKLASLVYERRGYVRARHIVTLHMKPADGQPGRFLVIELGGDVAERIVNEIQAASGVVAERRGTATR